MLRHVAAVFVFSFSSISFFGICGAADIADFGKEPIGKVPSFKKPGENALLEASADLSESLRPLNKLLSQSASGVDWRSYLDWSALETQAHAGKNLDVSVLLIDDLMRMKMDWKCINLSRCDERLLQQLKSP